MNNKFEAVLKGVNELRASGFKFFAASQISISLKQITPKEIAGLVSSHQKDLNLRMLGTNRNVIIWADGDASEIEIEMFVRSHPYFQEI